MPAVKDHPERDLYTLEGWQEGFSFARKTKLRDKAMLGHSSKNLFNRIYYHHNLWANASACCKSADGFARSEACADEVARSRQVLARGREMGSISEAKAKAAILIPGKDALAMAVTSFFEKKI